jgi:hypothetical protein
MRISYLEWAIKVFTMKLFYHVQHLWIDKYEFFIIMYLPYSLYSSQNVTIITAIKWKRWGEEMFRFEKSVQNFSRKSLSEEIIREKWLVN